MLVLRAAASNSRNAASFTIKLTATGVSPVAFPETQSAQFIGTHDETLSVAVSVNNPNCSPFKIQS